LSTTLRWQLTSIYFRTKLAAKRYALYWEKRVEVFGPDKAFLPLTLSGALRDDLETLRVGSVTLLAEPDPTGRVVCFSNVALHDGTKYPKCSLARSMWYVIQSALESERTQQCGLIIMSYPRNAKISEFDRVFHKKTFGDIKGALPVRISAVHICHPPGFFSLTFPLVKLFMRESLRKRIKVHSGSEEQVLDKLENYGFTTSMLPSELGGKYVLDPKGWVDARLAAGM
jgi:CRAL/TRIO domain